MGFISGGGALGATVDVTEMESLTKGTLIVGDGAGAPIAVAVGANTRVLSANSAQASGVEWVVPASGGDLVDDLTPQLGGDLDTNGNDIGFDNLKGVRDENGNEQLMFQRIANAVNYLEVANAQTGNAVNIASRGTDFTIDIQFEAVNNGNFLFNGNYVETNGVNLVAQVGNPGGALTLWTDGQDLFFGATNITGVGGG